MQDYTRFSSPLLPSAPPICNTPVQVVTYFETCFNVHIFLSENTPIQRFKRNVTHTSTRTIFSHLRSSPQLPFPLLRCSLSTQTQPPEDKEKELPFVAQYLISSFGFSPERALKVSADRNLAPIKSPARPQAVVKFLHDTGLTDAQIKAAISSQPTILAGNVDANLKPKVRELINRGFSRELVVKLIRYNPTVLYYSLNGTLSRLLFWRDFVGKCDEVLLKIISTNSTLFNFDIDKHIHPRFNLFKEYGFSNTDILSVVQRNRCLNKSLDSLRQTLVMIEEMGVPRGSKMFLRAVKAIGVVNEDKIKKRVEFFKDTYGWSQEDVNSAFRKFPNLVSYSENKVKLNMGFLIGKAGFEPRSIASDPVLIGLSVEGVLTPRFTVLHALKAKGLNIKCSLSTACRISEKCFYEKYVVTFENEVPGLHQAYGLRVPI